MFSLAFNVDLIDYLDILYLFYRNFFLCEKIWLKVVDLQSSAFHRMFLFGNKVLFNAFLENKEKLRH